MDGLGAMVQRDRRHCWDMNRLHWSYRIPLVPVSPGEVWGAGAAGVSLCCCGAELGFRGISEGFRGLWSVG